jgi:hypothetical protein
MMSAVPTNGNLGTRRRSCPMHVGWHSLLRKRRAIVILLVIPIPASPVCNTQW